MKNHLRRETNKFKKHAVKRAEIKMVSPRIGVIGFDKKQLPSRRPRWHVARRAAAGGQGWPRGMKQDNRFCGEFR